MCICLGHMPRPSCVYPVTHTHTHGQVRADLEAKSGKKYPEYQAVSYSTQVVAGINYFIKVSA